MADLRRSDHYRSKIGDWIVNFVPSLVRTQSGYTLFMWGCEAGRNAHYRKEVARFSLKYGLRVGRWNVQPKPWGMMSSRKILGFYVGRHV